MVGTGHSSIRRLKRLARGESTAVVMGMAGGILLAAVMWRGTVSSREETAAAARAAPPVAPAAAALLPLGNASRRTAESPPDDPALDETLAELEALPDSKGTTDSSGPPQSTAVLSVRSSDRTKSHPLVTPAVSEPSTPRTSSPKPSSPTGEATLACWNAINDIIAREAAMRVAPANLNAANAGGFVEARIRAGRFAGDSLRKLSSDNVDRDVIAHVGDLATWYDEEARLAGEASSLLGSTDFAARRGTAGKSWRGAEDRHRQRCDEINQHSTALQTQLSKRYGRPFPPLQ